MKSSLQQEKTSDLNDSGRPSSLGLTDDALPMIFHGLIDLRADQPTPDGVGENALGRPGSSGGRPFEVKNHSKGEEDVVSSAAKQSTKKGATASTSLPRFKDQFREAVAEPGLNKDSNDGDQERRKVGGFPSVTEKNKSGPNFKDQMRGLSSPRTPNDDGAIDTSTTNGGNNIAGKQVPAFKDKMRVAPPGTAGGRDDTHDNGESPATANAAGHLSPSTDPVVPGDTPFAELHAVAVSDTVLRQEFLDDFLNRIPLAEATTPEETGAKPLVRNCILGFVLFFLLVVGIVVAVVCGNGNCGKGTTDNDPPTVNRVDAAPSTAPPGATPSPTVNVELRAVAITELINNRTYSGKILTYPSLRSGEERALKWIIDDDPLKLTVLSNSSKILQRYALATLWYIAGPWPHSSLSANNQWWLVGPEECEWDGLVCSDDSVMTDIFLQQSSLERQIPSDLGLLTGLTRLDLDLNKLSGMIPSAISQLTKLTLLELWSNKLTGNIPSQLATLTLLKRLDIQDNQLVGTIPSELSVVSNLDAAYFGINNLTGTMPFCSRNYSIPVLQADCNEVKCDCCTQCM